MARELSDAAVYDQAEAFLAWSCKKGGDYVEAFKLWATSKDFAPEDREAIFRAVRTIGSQGAA